MHKNNRINSKMAVSGTTTGTSTYAVVTNIPKLYHSVDLRRFFSTLVEKNCFDCFHFRHRPELRRIPESSSSSSYPNDSKPNEETFCCVVQLPVKHLSDFIIMYNRKHWTDKEGNPMPSVCLIKKIKVDSACDLETAISSSSSTNSSFSSTVSTVTSSEDSTSSSTPNPSSAKPLLSFRDLKRSKNINSEEERNFTPTEIRALKELHPPLELMPRGNVGTSTEFYLDKIRRCLLPSKIIKQLGLEFPKSKGNRKYSNVPPPSRRGMFRPEEEDEEQEEQVEEEPGKSDETERFHFPVRDGNGHVLVSQDEMNGNACGDQENDDGEEEDGRNDDEEEESGEEDTATEEWDRHNSLNNDVTAQGRCKERLFEEEIELKWEKGGSGLVFYTDAQFWKEHDGENDFDFETADDLDVDMSVYYEKGGGDQDAKDAADIRREAIRRRGAGDLSGLETMRRNGGSLSSFHGEKQTLFKVKQIGEFEKFTKGFGRKLMEKQGWTDGRGLGTDAREGVADALEGDGQAPNSRIGLGFREELLAAGSSSRFHIQKRHLLSGEERRAKGRKLFDAIEEEDQYVLPTKYDKCDQVNEKDNVLRSAVPESNKEYGWNKSK